MHRKRNMLTAAVVAGILLGTAGFIRAETTAERSPVFLSRKAVVKEEGGKKDLASQAKKIIPIIDIRTKGFSQKNDAHFCNQAAGVLMKYIGKIAGVTCTVQKAGTSPVAPVRIVLGCDKTPADEFPELQAADDHGFLLKAQKNQDQWELRIVSRTGIGTLYGAWFFLMNYAGVRIVLPGELGEVYEQQDALSIPSELYVFNPGPDFVLRVYSGANGLDRYAWLGDTEASQRIEYHHNSSAIFPPDKYGASHPEYFPMLAGERCIPPTKEQYEKQGKNKFNARPGSSWQPTFSETSVVARAVEYADEYFTQNPWKMSISLGPNDGEGFSELDIQKARQLPDGGTISDIYYAYVNAVARQVAKKWPGKYVCCFGDYLLLHRPACKMEDNVMVVCVNANGEPPLILAEWKNQARQFVIYQWAYGDEYVFPNHWPHAMQDYLNKVYQAGCRAFKAENYPAWVADAPKWWVVNNLLWNTGADVDGLLRDYYEHAYGKEAAPAMARYFDAAEQIYERRRTPEEYQIVLEQGYKHGERQFRDVRAEDWDKMGKALEDALQAVKGENNRRRVELTSKRYAFGKSFWNQYGLVKKMARSEVRSDDDVKKVMDLVSDFDAATQQRAQYFRENIGPYPQYCYAPKDTPTNNAWNLERSFKWTEWNGSLQKAFSAVTEYKKTTQKPAEILAYWAEVARKNDALKMPAAIQRLQVVAGAKQYADTAFDLTYGAMVNLQAVNELAGRASAPVTPEDIKIAVAKVRAANEANGMAAELLQSGLFVTAVEPYAGRMLVCNRVATPPKLDGKPDDAAWKEAPVYSEFYKAGSTNPANSRTELRLTHDDSNLYVYARCYQDTNSIATFSAKRDGKLWYDDGIEMMINAPDATKTETRFQLVVNTRGNIWDYLNGNAKWDGHIQAAVSMLADGYGLELAIPLAEIGIDPVKQRFWRFNFVRNVQMGLNKEIAQWYSAIYGNIDVRSRGWLIFN